jgi:hypothetical protein
VLVEKGVPERTSLSHIIAYALRIPGAYGTVNTYNVSSLHCQKFGRSASSVWQL